MPQKAIIGSVTSRLKTMAGYFHEIPEEHQLPFSELTESFNSLEEYMSSDYSQDEQLFCCFALCEPSFLIHECS